jgi:hypothetical protein
MARLAPSGFLDANAPATARTTTPVSTPQQAAERIEPGAMGSTTPLIDPVALGAGFLAGALRGGLLGSATRAAAARAAAPAAVEAAPTATPAAATAATKVSRVLLGDPVPVEAFGEGAPGGQAIFHEIRDESGRALAGMTVSFPKPDRALIRGIFPAPGSGVGPTTLGPSHVRDILRQFKALYPDVKMIGGTRVTGVSTGAPRFTSISLGALAAALGLKGQKDQEQ